MQASDLQYISDGAGAITGVVVPIELWKALTDTDETAYLLQNPVMRQRLLEAKERANTPEDDISMEEAFAQLGL